MKKLIGTLFLTLCVALVPATALAQVIRGMVLDAETGDSLAAASVVYRGNRVAAIADINGHYVIGRHNGWNLTFSALGYKSQTITVTANTPELLNIRLKADVRSLEEVVIKAKKNRYRRKDNPAVTLMKRVIAARKQNKLENNDYYQYRNYERITLSNLLRKESVDSGLYARKDYLKEHVQYDTAANRYTLPMITTEKVSRVYYNKELDKTKTVIEGERSEGVNDLIETGDMFTSIVKDVFTDVDIYEDNIRLLRNRFTSPIGNGATDFYRYYIIDTVMIDRHQCIQLSFLPNNQQDFGFRGELWVVNDSSLHVRRIKIGLPKHTDVNFVRSMDITQEYEQLDNGEWVLSVNDMDVDASVTGQSGNLFITRTSRRTDYSFAPIAKKIFRGTLPEKYDPNARNQDADYWTANRDVPLVKGEESMSKFIQRLRSTKGFGWAIFFANAVLENFVSTGSSSRQSKVDIGPITSMFSANDIDGFRLRPAFQTTAALCRHAFLDGYYAHGFKSKGNYYGATLTIAFNKPRYLPQEFPRNNLSFSSSYDIRSASDSYMRLNKDNVFAAWKWSKVLKMAYSNRQTVEYEREEDWGFATKVGFKAEHLQATGSMFFAKMTERPPVITDSDSPAVNGSMRTSEFYVELTYQPNQQYINMKMDRFTLNREAPIFKLKHTWGVSGLFGGQYDYHMTEAAVYKRFWLKNIGKIDTYLRAGFQWSTVPFPLLIAPAANLSYIRQYGMFTMIDNMEFLNDRFVSLVAEWDLQGKVLNRIPLIKKLKWREHIGFNVLWGSLSDKNNPTLPRNAANDRLMQMPAGSYAMNIGEPYCEMVVGFHNIFKLFRVDYVRRFNYLDYGATANSFRLGFEMSF